MTQAAGNPGSGIFTETVRIVRGQYGYRAGTSGTVALPAGARVMSWSAFATASGATVSIDSGANIPVPTGGSVSGEAFETLGAATFVFTGTAGYFIEFIT